MKFQTPIIKFIEGKEMIIPITKNGYILSHKDYVNYFYPLKIEIVDSKGIFFLFKKANIIGTIDWFSSFFYLSKLYKIKPVLIEEPKTLTCKELKEKIVKYVSLAKIKFPDEKEELNEITEKIDACDSIREIIKIIHSSSYWK